MSTQPIALCLQATNSIEHQSSASERIWFCMIIKEQFAATYIKTFVEQQPIYPPEININVEKENVGVICLVVCPQAWHWLVQ